MPDYTYWPDTGYWSNGWWGEESPAGSVTGYLSLALLKPIVSFEGNISQDGEVALELLQPIVAIEGNTSTDGTMELTLDTISLNFDAHRLLNLKFYLNIEFQSEDY